MKKGVKIILIIVGIVLLFTLIFYAIDNSKQNNNTRTYKIDISNYEEISSVTIDTLSEFEEEKVFTDKETIETIYNVFKNKTTDKESINDNPVEPDILFSVVFKDDKGDYKLVYIYKKNNKYYIVQPYNGIYESSEEDFKKIEGLVK